MGKCPLINGAEMQRCEGRAEVGRKEGEEGGPQPFLGSPWADSVVVISA